MTKGQRSTLVIFAHELREPLASVLLAARMLSEDVSDPRLLRELVGLIERQIQYLSKLIDGALEAERHAGDNRRRGEEWFDLTPVIGSAVEVVAPAMRSGGHRLGIALPPGPLCTIGDPVCVQQVLINLLANAAKYTPPGGSIQLNVEKSEAHLVIRVNDNGIGMAPALLKRVFDLFERGDVRPSTVGYTGLGIGLAVVKALVERHGGTVSAHSAGVGAGSTFVVHLPRTSAVDMDDKTIRESRQVRSSSTSNSMCDA